jgi:putative ABC transport system permease protein
MLGDRIVDSLPLPLILSLRSQVQHRRTSTILTILALSASVALAMIVEMSTRSVAIPLEQTTNALMGSSRISVEAGGVGVDESVVDIVISVPGVEVASPIIARTFRIASGDLQGEPIRLIGVDLLAPQGVRSFGVAHSRGAMAARDPIRLLASPNAIIVSQGLASRLGVHEGDSIRLRLGANTHEFVIRGTLTGSLAEAFGGQIATMDVFGLQEVLGFRGRVDRVDVSPTPGTDVDLLVRALSDAVGPGASVNRSEHREIYFDSVMEMLRVGVWSIVAISVLLSLFITYSVTSLTIDRRIEELGLLRMAGWTGASVTNLILIDTAVLSVVATILGLGIAALSANTLVEALSGLSSYLRFVEIPPASVHASTLLIGALVGPPVTMLASASPAYRAGRQAPLDVLRIHQAPPSADRVSRRLLFVGFAAVAVAVAATVASGTTVTGRVEVVAVVLGSIVGAAILIVQLVLRAHTPIQEMFGRLFPRIGYLAFDIIIQKPLEAGVTIAVWSAVTASVVAMFTMIHSFVVSIDDFWEQLHGRDSVMVLGQAPLSSRDREPISEKSIRSIRSTPGVLSVAEYHNIRVFVRGGDAVMLGSISTQTIQDIGGASVYFEDPKVAVPALMRGEISVNAAFSKYFGKGIGDEIQLATKSDLRRFRIGAIERTYHGPKGGLSIDISEFHKWFDSAGAQLVVISTRSPQSEVLESIHRRVENQSLFFRTFTDVRHTEQVVGRFEGLLVLPVFLIAGIGALALMIVLSGNVVARSHDLTVLRAAGASRPLLSMVLVLNGTVVALVGTVLGFLLSIPWSVAFSDLMTGVLGYRADLATDTTATFVILAGAIGLSVLSAGLSAALGRGGTNWSGGLP